VGKVSVKRILQRTLQSGQVYFWSDLVIGFDHFWECFIENNMQLIVFSSFNCLHFGNRIENTNPDWLSN